MNLQPSPRMTDDQRIVLLAQNFPCCRAILDDGEWNVARLTRRYGTASNGERQVISFLLTVWNTEQDWVPKFNAAEAMMGWDNGHRRAFAAWVAAPFCC